MNIGRIDKQILKIMNASKTVRKISLGDRESKFRQEACYRISGITGVPLSEIQELTVNASFDNLTFLKALSNKFHYNRAHSIKEQPEHLLNIYSIVEKPTAQHLNILRKTNDSFESLEKIFSLAKNKEALLFVEDLQYNELKHSNYASKIIIDLLSSKNADRYIANTERYSSYLELNADNKDAVKNLDRLIETGKFSRFRFDAKLAVTNLFRKQRVETAMAGKTNDLEMMYTKDREGFLKNIIKYFMPAKKSPEEETKAVVVEMYGSLNSANSKLRNAIVERFKKPASANNPEELAEMQKLFARIDKDKDANIFVQKAISKDLRLNSIAELNEIIDTIPLKKANIFFNNTKRIIEKTEGEERKTALILEMENPFYEAKNPKKHSAKMVRMFADNTTEKDDFFTRAYKTIENKINQYKYSKLSA